MRVVLLRVLLLGVNRFSSDAVLALPFFLQLAKSRIILECRALKFRA
jgi:hypothetical protein